MGGVRLYSTLNLLGRSALNCCSLQYSRFLSLMSSGVPLMLVPEVRYCMISYCKVARLQLTVAIPGTRGIWVFKSTNGRPSTSSLPLRLKTSLSSSSNSLGIVGGGILETWK